MKSIFGKVIKIGILLFIFIFVTGFAPVNTEQPILLREQKKENAEKVNADVQTPDEIEDASEEEEQTSVKKARAFPGELSVADSALKSKIQAGETSGYQVQVRMSSYHVRRADFYVIMPENEKISLGNGEEFYAYEMAKKLEVTASKNLKYKIYGTMVPEKDWDHKNVDWTLLKKSEKDDSYDLDQQYKAFRIVVDEGKRGDEIKLIWKLTFADAGKTAVYKNKVLVPIGDSCICVWDTYSAKITVETKPCEEASFELPSAGGPGKDLMFQFAGGMIFFAGSGRIFYYLRKKQKRVFK